MVSPPRVMTSPPPVVVFPFPVDQRLCQDTVRYIARTVPDNGRSSR
jgi:hypothetical protein